MVNQAENNKGAITERDETTIKHPVSAFMAFVYLLALLSIMIVSTESTAAGELFSSGAAGRV